VVAQLSPLSSMVAGLQVPAPQSALIVQICAGTLLQCWRAPQAPSAPNREGMSSAVPQIPSRPEAASRPSPSRLVKLLCPKVPLWFESHSGSS
jgi:hypothetical protein